MYSIFLIINNEIQVFCYDIYHCCLIIGRSACSFYRTCWECRDDPECGWCDDGSGTGLGDCLPGGNIGPHSPDYACPADHWFFTCCPSKKTSYVVQE